MLIIGFTLIYFILPLMGLESSAFVQEDLVTQQKDELTEKPSIRRLFLIVMLNLMLNHMTVFNPYFLTILNIFFTFDSCAMYFLN